MEDDMTKWELAAQSIRIEQLGHGNPEKLLDKDEKTGKSAWDSLQAKAESGWELVSVTPINRDGYTLDLLYTFKRPIEDSE